MQSQTQQQEKLKIPGTVIFGQKEMHRPSTLPDVWMVQRKKKAFLICAFDVSGNPEFANVEFASFEKACEFAQAANEMVKR